MTTNPSTARGRLLRERREEQGLRRLDLYAHPADHPAIKALARKLTEDRYGNQATDSHRDLPKARRT